MGTFPALFLALASAATDTGVTDFGVRRIGGGPITVGSAPGNSGVSYRPLGSRVESGLRAAVSLAGQWGRVTSTVRSPEHNRRVGGVRNSFHLSGQAIDVARRRDVAHWQIEAFLRHNGFRIVESLDEGDHSHFAFDLDRASSQLRPASAGVATSSNTVWRIVRAPR